MYLLGRTVDFIKTDSFYWVLDIIKRQILLDISCLINVDVEKNYCSSLIVSFGSHSLTNRAILHPDVKFHVLY